MFRYLLRKAAKKHLKLVRRENNMSRSGDFVIFANDLIGDYIVLDGVYAKREIVFLRSVLDKVGVSPNSVAIDVGANIGNHARALAELFTLIYCFEPSFRNFQLLRINSEASKKIVPLNYGLGAGCGREILGKDVFNCGASSVKLDALDLSGDSTEEVTIKVGDKVLGELIGERSLGFVKIDVEGMELDVLIGMDSTISEHRPVIGFEFKCKNPKQGAELLEFLSVREYLFFWQRELASFALLRRLSRKGAFFWELCCGAKPPSGLDMVIAVPKEKSFCLVNNLAR